MNRIRIALAILLAALIAAPARPQEQSTTPTAATPPAAQTDQQAPPASASNPVRVHFSGRVENAKLIHMVQPAYPQEAKEALISGTVVLHAVIAQDGSVQQLEYVSGPEELKQAALDAVGQWKYQPTMLNGEPVAVNTTINVVFTLDKSSADQPPSAAQADQQAPATKAALAPHPMRIRVGGSVQQTSLIRQVPPHYPPVAKTAHVSGTVILHIIVSTDGSVEQVDFVSGPLLLRQAAVDAVKQWKYRPTLLNGQPVEVDTTVQVVFTHD